MVQLHIKFEIKKKLLNVMKGTAYNQNYNRILERDWL